MHKGRRRGEGCGRKRKRNLGKSTFKEVSKPFYDFEEIKPVKFTRDSNWLARYDFLVIREGYHVDLHIFSSLIVGVLCCTALAGVGNCSRQFIRINFRITF